MQHAAAQLKQVRRVGRLLLVVRPLLQWVAAMLIIALGLGVLDYLLILPDWLRFALGMMVTGLALLWLILRLRLALGLPMDLTALALRAERMYPHLSGVLATSVEFAGLAADPDSPRTQALVRHSMDDAQRKLSGVNLTRLIDPAPTLRVAMVATGVLLVVASIALVWPAQAWLATQRWVTPFAAVYWPKRTGVESLMHQTVWPADTPLRLRARVVKGHHAGMRIWATHRVIHENDQAGAWQSQLMSDQSAGDSDAASTTAAGDFERLIDAFAPAEGLTTAAGGVLPHAVEFQFASSDDQTTVQRMQLIQRPRLTTLSAAITPPAYAQGLVTPETVDLLATGGLTTTVRALAGSRVVLTMGFNKALPEASLSLATMLPGLVAADVTALRDVKVQRQGAEGQGVTVSFRLDGSVQSPVTLRDEYDLQSLSQKVYRFEAITDHQPAVSMTQPASDESVLASARLELAASIQDDVGAAWLWIHLKKAGADEPATELVKTQGRQVGLEARHGLDLSPMKLAAGSVLEIWAAGQDVYELDGARHEVVKSATRRISIIEPAALAARIAQDLQSIRQEAVRLQQQQRVLREQAASIAPSQARAQQGQISQRIASQEDALQSLAQRMENNRLEDGELNRLLSQAGKHLEEAREASEAAGEHLQKAAEAGGARSAGESDPQKRGEQEAQAKTPAGEAESQNATAQKNDPQDGSQPASQNSASSQQSQQGQQGQQSQASQQGQSSSQQQAGSQQQSGQQQAGQQGAQQQSSAHAPSQSQDQAQAQAQQDKTSEELAKLVALLDEGRDAMALQMQLQQLAARQKELAQQTREQLPKTLGKTPEQLTQEEKQALEEIARQQEAMAQQAQELAQKMQAAARAMASGKNPQGQPETPSARQQAMAQALAQAAQTAQQEGLSQSMQKSAESVQQNQLASAASGQQQSQETLEKMLQEMNKQQELAQEILKRQMQQLAQALEKLIAQQAQQLEAAGKAPSVKELDAPASTLRRNTNAVAQEMAQSPEMAEPSQQVAESAQAQAKAIESMRADDAQQARASQQKSLAHLETALRKLREEQQRQAQSSPEDQKREELRGQYEQLAAKQRALREDTQKLAAGGELDRRGRVKAMELANLEGAIQTQARTLAQEVQNLVVFRHMHQQIDRMISSVTRELRAGKADDSIMQGQAQVETALLQLAAALEQSGGKKPEFASGQDQNQQGGGGGGGQAGKPAIPPLAELRLLRQVQEHVYQETRRMDEMTQGKPVTPEVRRDIIELSGRQRELAGLGSELIQQVQRQQGGQR